MDSNNSLVHLRLFATNVDPTEETVVVVGGKYLDQLDKVMDTVDQIRKQTWRVPSSVFLFSDEKFDIDLHKLNITRRDVFSPTLVTLNLVSSCQHFI